MRVKPEHLRGYVPGDAHNRLVARLSLRQLCDRMVPKIVEPKAMQRALYVGSVGLALIIGARLARLLLLTAPWAVNRPRKVTPRGAPPCHWFRSVRFSEALEMREDVPFRLWL